MSAVTIAMGKMNRLSVVKEVDFGLYLDGGELPDGRKNEILLPTRYVPRGTKIGDEIEVFIYRDSEDRIIATTEQPYVMVGDFACLKVVSVNKTGAFLDWGLPKDLLVPFDEMEHRMEEGKRYVVGVYVDEETDRITASARLDALLYDESEDDFEEGEEVDLFVANKSELGYKVIVNTSHWGLLHFHEVVRPLKRGERMRGFIKRIRPDGKIDIALHSRGRDKTDEGVESVLRELKNAGGFLPVTDKSTPETINGLFGLSKGMYKKAVGSLYKRKLIVISNDGILLVAEQKKA
ncbi:MAG: GntR family transcriptional regulator [Zetaproteobacteria bacterium CG06_land_8_20_14_3_00_59_53]|nr:MAG: GntR family transcriptional regulator [Zetaproteobacteria bacterium CG2_30_59_37]PIO89289.1 MAG: GntR family transcriptional regulator [Zetaproteobacteria bacterium CG23_combo_of_CG06-09_8_20_14_all_59_86]PIQ65375.1 MAG: GntR family transcriptional regulator [Zetaproteobacteria bacterium CG11_big_fil_rev_8_21_14_0_20_59_439]PIU70701.1 MAG: GntR family transcriptional regulator [Zetaproteobacteria bacterium CG06_land_8_20_14_3_00_59_53]PIU98143.1 MAG: GntR family transcriptional regulato